MVLTADTRLHADVHLFTNAHQITTSGIAGLDSDLLCPCFRDRATTVSQGWSRACLGDTRVCVLRLAPACSMDFANVAGVGFGRTCTVRPL
jgi:hypothetical protein